MKNHFETRRLNFFDWNLAWFFQDNDSFVNFHEYFTFNCFGFRQITICVCIDSDDEFLCFNKKNAFILFDISIEFSTL